MASGHPVGEDARLAWVGRRLATDVAAIGAFAAEASIV
jgi:hypothetical protein